MMSPPSSFSRVDFPEPFLPIRQSRSPTSNCRLIPSSSTGPPKATLTFCKVSNATRTPSPLLMRFIHAAAGNLSPRALHRETPPPQFGNEKVAVVPLDLDDPVFHRPAAAAAAFQLARQSGER